MRRFRLMVENEVFNGAELRGDVRLSFLPFLEVVGEILGFKVKGTTTRLGPTLLCHIICRRKLVGSLPWGIPTVVVYR
jgi:hypothetical protein